MDDSGHIPLPAGEEKNCEIVTRRKADHFADSANVRGPYTCEGVRARSFRLPETKRILPDRIKIRRPPPRSLVAVAPPKQIDFCTVVQARIAGKRSGS